MITQALLPLGLAFIMFTLGLGLRPADFRLRLKPVAVGLACKLVLLPLAGLAVVLAWKLPAEFAVGMVILAACPAGVTSSLLTQWGGGRVALAAAVTALTSLAATLTLPLLTNLGLALFAGYQQAVELPVGRMTLGVVAVDTLPLALGLAIRHWKPDWAAKGGRVARPVANLLFGIIVLGAFFSQREAFVAHFDTVVPAAVVLNLLAMVLAWTVSAGLEREERVAVVMENGLQNGALGIFVAATLLGSPAMMVPSIVYALVMNLTAFAFIAVMRRQTAVIPKPN